MMSPPPSLTSPTTHTHLPLSLSPSSFCLSGSTPVKVLMDCLRSMTVSSSDSELMEYSWPPHLMITDTDMAHTGSSHQHTHTNTHTHTQMQLPFGMLSRRRCFQPQVNDHSLKTKRKDTRRMPIRMIMSFSVKNKEEINEIH